MRGKAIATMLAALAFLQGAGESEVCGSFYTADDFVGAYLMETGTGFVVSDSGGPTISLTNSASGPATIFAVGDELTLSTEYVDFNMEVAETPDYALPDLAEDLGVTLNIEALPGLLGCPLDQLQRFQGGIETTTAEGEGILYIIVAVVTSQNADGEPDQMMGTIYWFAQGMNSQRGIFLTRQE